MHAPYDRERGQAPGGDDPPPGFGERSDHPGQHAGGHLHGGDPYLADSYHQDPYAHRDPLAQDPVGEALNDRAAYPPPQAPGGYPPPGAGAVPHPPGGGGPAGHGPGGHGPAPGSHGPGYGGYPGPQPYHGGPGPQQPSPGGSHAPPDDAFAYLFRDQQFRDPQTGPHPVPGHAHASGPPGPAGPAGPPSPHGPAGPPGPAGQPVPPAAGPPASGAPPGQPGPPPGPPLPEPEPEPEPAAAEQSAAAPAGRRPGRAASLLKSSAIMAAGTLVSRVTGFVRQLVIVAALGAAVLGDTYTVAWALPSMIYILTIGGGLNSVFVPQLVRAMKNDEDGGDAYANRLLTLVMAVLGGLVIAAVLAAPLLIKLMSPSIADDPAANEVSVTFARYFLPTIFFMGVHVVMGQILNARDHFGPMMWTPVLNNIVVIFTFGTFLWVYGTQRTSGMSVTTITPEGVRLLGVGTLLGLVVQAVAMLPYLRAAGFRLRPRFDWRGHGMGKAARLAKWTVLFVLANQVGLVVITQLSTWAGMNAEQEGYPGTGFIAYNSALLIWQMPQAIITVSVMAALLPRISRSAADGDVAAVRDDLSHGLRTSAVAIVPIAFAFVALGVPMCTLLFGAAGEEGARSFGYVLMAFGLGLIPFSAQYVVLRAFYAYEDTRTPFYNTVIVSAAWIALSGLSFVALPNRWVVCGIAFSYGIAYAIGVVVAWRRLRNRMGADLDGPRVVRTYIRLCGASLPAALLGGAASFAIVGALGEGMLGSLVALVGGGSVLLVVFFLAARRMRIEELTSLVGMVRARLGR